MIPLLPSGVNFICCSWFSSGHFSKGQDTMFNRDTLLSLLFQSLCRLCICCLRWLLFATEINFPFKEMMELLIQTMLCHKIVSDWMTKYWRNEDSVSKVGHVDYASKFHSFPITQKNQTNIHLCILEIVCPSSMKTIPKSRVVEALGNVFKYVLSTSLNNNNNNN